VNLAVTPVIYGLTITPGPAPNIVFLNGKDGSAGLTTFAAGVEGATFIGSVDKASIKGTVVFIQDVLNIQNGVNGTTYNSNPVGYL
jgi:hypothetical protein